MDGDMSTRWSSRQAYEGGQSFEWIVVDLGTWHWVNRVVLKWEAAYARRYEIWAWNGSGWDVLARNNNGRGGTEALTFNSRPVRWIAMIGLEKFNSSWGYSLWEFEVYGSSGALSSVPSVGERSRTDEADPLRYGSATMDLTLPLDLEALMRLKSFPEAIDAPVPAEKLELQK